MPPRTIRVLVLLALLGFGATGCRGLNGGGLGRSPRVRVISGVSDRPDRLLAEQQPDRPRTISSRVDPPLAEADRDSGVIAGRVVDDQGTPVANAKVRLAHSGAPGGRVISGTTDRSGKFRLTGLDPNESYTLVAEWEDSRELLFGRAKAKPPNGDVQIRVAPYRSDEGADPGPRLIDGPARRPQSQATAPDNREPFRPDPPLAINREDLLDHRSSRAEPLDPPLTQERPSSDDRGWPRSGSDQSSDRLRNRSGNRSGSGWVPTGSVRPAAHASASEEPSSNRQRALDQRSSHNDDSEPDPLWFDRADDPKPNRPSRLSGPSENPLPPAIERPNSDFSLSTEGLEPPSSRSPSPEPLNPRPEPFNRQPSRDQQPTDNIPVESVEPIGDSARSISVGSVDSNQPQPELENRNQSRQSEPSRRPPGAFNVPRQDSTTPEPAEEPISEPPTDPKPATDSIPSARQTDEPEPGLSPIPELPEEPFAEPPADGANAPENREPEPNDQAASRSLNNRQPPTWGQLPDPQPITQANQRSRNGNRLVRQAENDGREGRRFSANPRNWPLRPFRMLGLFSRRRSQSEPAPKAPEVQPICQFDEEQRQLQDFVLPDLQGQPFRWQNVESDHVLLCFWGTWYEPCQETIAQLTELQRQFRPSELQVVGIAYERDGQGGPKEVAKVAQQRGVNFPMLMAPADQPCPVGDAFNVQFYPTLVLLDAQGNILWRKTGATPETLRQLQPTIAEAVGAGSRTGSSPILR